jgi:hypothetical protein
VKVGRGRVHLKVVLLERARSLRLGRGGSGVEATEEDEVVVDIVQRRMCSRGVEAFRRRARRQEMLMRVAQVCRGEEINFW